MNENKKQMNDVNTSVQKPRTTSFANEALNRPPVNSSGNMEQGEIRSGNRIEQNPFFDKGRKKVEEQKVIQKSGSHPLIWVLVIIVLLGGGFGIANYFSSATVSVVPITRNLSVDNDFTALKDGSANDLTFQFMSVTDESSKTVAATIEKKLQIKASGKVIIYNAYNSSSQRLIKNTRLESPDHKIFRIDESVVVPGATVIGGKVTVPGSVEAVAYADVPGKDYNIGLSDFTIPGFKDDPRYSKFTAKSKADSPISGGFSGTVNVPSDESIASAQASLKEDLKKSAVEKARAQVPEGVTFFPGSVIIKFEEVPQDYSTGDASVVTMKATVSVFFFDTRVLIKSLSESLLSSTDATKTFTAPDISSLLFTFTTPVDKVVLSDIKEVKFHLSGDTVFIGNVDSGALSALFANKNKSDFSKIISELDTIEKADAVIRPMWKNVFPSESSQITIKTVTE